MPHKSAKKDYPPMKGHPGKNKEDGEMMTARKRKQMMKRKRKMHGK